MTQYRFAFSSLAELKEAALHYEEIEKGLGSAFLDEIDATISRILAHPLAWHRLSPRKAMPYSPLSIRCHLSDSFQRPFSSFQ
jgi:hypothetical protein